MSICFNPCGGAASVDRGELVFSKNSHSSSPEEKADEPPDHRNQAISVQPKSTVPSGRSDMKGLKQTSPVSAAVLPYAEDGLLTRGYRWLAGMFNRVAAWLKPASPSTDSSTGPGNGVPHTPKVNCAEIACDKKAGEKAVLSENKKPDANLAEPGAQDLDMLREVVSDQELKLQDLLWTQCANTKSVPNNSHSTRLPLIMNSTGLRLQQDLLGQIPEKRKPMEGAQHLPQKHTNDTRMFIESEDIPHFHNRSAYDFILYTTIDQNGKGVRVRIPRSPIARRAAPTIHRDRTQNAHYKVLRAMRNSGFLPDTGDPDDTFCKSRQARLKDQRLEDYSQLLDVRLSDGERYKRTERLLQNQGCQVPATKLNGVNKANTDDKKNSNISFINALLQHATGIYNENYHHNAAVDLQRWLFNDVNLFLRPGERIVSINDTLDPSGPLVEILIDEINCKHRCNMLVSVVRIDSKGPPGKIDKAGPWGQRDNESNPVLLLRHEGLFKPVTSD